MSTLTAKLTSDKEIFITETEREFDVWTQTYLSGIGATTYAILVSLSNENFPHKLQGQTGARIDATNIGFSYTLANATEARLRFGVISRIDGTNADIKFAVCIPLLSGGARVSYTMLLKGTPSQVKFGLNNGVLTHGLTNQVETNVAAVNTGAVLASPAGNIAPGLGDLILKIDHTSGSLDLACFVFYHTN